MGVYVMFLRLFLRLFYCLQNVTLNSIFLSTHLSLSLPVPALCLHH